MMDPLQELLDWATSHGVRLNGIAPERISGHGIGVIATRDIQVSHNLILTHLPRHLGHKIISY